jgi:hypothetical protein
MSPTQLLDHPSQLRYLRHHATCAATIPQFLTTATTITSATIQCFRDHPTLCFLSIFLREVTTTIIVVIIVVIVESEWKLMSVESVGEIAEIGLAEVAHQFEIFLLEELQLL